ncbi:MAG TPA: hypothetical protein VMH04_05290 [Candidatus Solibacter sp.]|nr:hypothetical protein [Candidatus Solibacter sp.]
MAQIDPEQERERLAEVYAHQTDEELAAVAQQGYELTEVAREALRAELVKRGLYTGQLEEISATGEESAEFRDLVTIRSYWSLSEGQMAKGLIESAGIDAFLFDENMLNLNWFNANAIGGVKLRVDARNVEAANQILEEKATGEAEPEEADLPDDNLST